VRSLSGVRGVANLIPVRPGARLSPDEVKAKIEQALLRSAEIEAERITVDVEDDKVILRGGPGWDFVRYVFEPVHAGHPDDVFNPVKSTS
jgi:hypothetical protein